MGIEPEYESLEQAKEFMALMLGYYNDVASPLQSNQPHKLILKPCTPSDKRLDYQAWCEGYILGWGLSTQEWLQPGNEPLKRLTFPILYLSGAFKEEAERQGTGGRRSKSLARLCRCTSSGCSGNLQFLVIKAEAGSHTAGAAQGRP